MSKYPLDAKMYSVTMFTDVRELNKWLQCPNVVYIQDIQYQPMYDGEMQIPSWSVVAVLKESAYRKEPHPETASEQHRRPLRALRLSAQETLVQYSTSPDPEQEQPAAPEAQA